jgi:hypothetical protein
MGLIDVARDTLKEIPMADILRERLSLALDQFAESERQKSTLQTEVGALQARLQNAQLDRDKAQQELKRLQKEHEDETVIHSLLEFRRGKRTQNRWAAFCPKCHMPANVTADEDGPQAYCPSCSYIANLPAGTRLDRLLAQLPD